MRILCVEDDRELADILRRGLVEQSHTVDVVHDGESARHAALTDEYELVLLDLMIPRLDGVAVCHAIREAGKVTPVIMLTARDSIEDRILGLDSGADDYLVKPFAMGELFARIRSLRRRVGRRTSDVLRVGALSLDPGSDCVEISGKQVRLTAREFGLLHYFMLHPGRIASKTELLESVWDANYDGLSNVVEVYVNYLRNKLEQGGEPRRIKTVRGRGYVLKEPEREA